MKKGQINNLIIVSLAVIFTYGCSPSSDKKEEVDLNGIFYAILQRVLCTLSFGSYAK
jgi:hypothetical protein